MKKKKNATRNANDIWNEMKMHITGRDSKENYDGEQKNIYKIGSRVEFPLTWVEEKLLQITKW